MDRTTGLEERGSFDWILLGAVAGLIAIGLMMVYSSTYDLGYRLEDDTAYFFKKQLLWMFLGAIAMGIAIRMDYRHWMKLSIPIMAASLAMLLAVVLLSEGRQLLGNSVSPAEPAKVAVIIYISHWLASRSALLRKVPYGLLPFTIMVGIVAGLVMAQPDLSEAVVIVVMSVAMFFLAGADVLQFAIGILGGTGAFVLVITKLPAAMERLQPFLNEWQDPLNSTNNQFVQGVIALGSGGVFGFGPGSGRMKYQWLPAAHTDSIFAVLGEELGLVGCLALIGLFAVLAYRGFRIAEKAPDAFGRLLALGFTCWIVFQAMMNVAVVTGTIPFTGIALPFISVGGSSLVTCMVGVGIMLSVSRARPQEAAVVEGDATTAAVKQKRASKKRPRWQPESEQKVWP